MEHMKVSSPRDDALKIARKTRDVILSGEQDVEKILRACYSIVIGLGRNRDTNLLWITWELSGYQGISPFYVPMYRNVFCTIKNIRHTPERIDILDDAHTLSLCLREKSGIQYKRDGGDVFLDTTSIARILNRVIDNCLDFLCRIIPELEFGGTVEVLMEEIRKKTDEQFAKMDIKLSNEAETLYQNLKSENPAEWSQVGHSCRRILILLADKVFSPQKEPQKGNDGKLHELGEKEYVNRLCAFLDQKTSGDEKGFHKAELEYLKSYLSTVVEFDNKGEHAPEIKKSDAELMAIHTYLICSEILGHLS